MSLVPLHPNHPMRGRGMWVWNGDVHNPHELAKVLRAHSFRWLALKAQEGTSAYQPSQIGAYREACHEHGLELLLWGYLHGHSPEAEANLAIALCRRYGAAGYIADCEIEYERAPAGRSERLAHALNHGNPRLALALSSFGRIDLHPGIDWGAYARNRFAFMPQAYSCESHELAAGLCIEAAKRFWHPGQILPTVGAYKGAAGMPSGRQLGHELDGRDLRGFSVWDSASVTADQLRVLASV